jgi:hypothetical protein
MTCHALDAATAVQQPGLKPIHAVEFLGVYARCQIGHTKGSQIYSVSSVLALR